MRVSRPSELLSETPRRHAWPWVVSSLWTKGAGRCHVNLVDTVLCERGNFVAWYFTSSRTGEVLRKAEKNATVESVQRKFVRTALSYDDNAWRNV